MAGTGEHLVTLSQTQITARFPPTHPSDMKMEAIIWEEDRDQWEGSEVAREGNRANITKYNDSLRKMELRNNSFGLTKNKLKLL